GKVNNGTYFLVTGLRVHLGCRSGAAAEGEQQEGSFISQRRRLPLLPPKNSQSLGVSLLSLTACCCRASRAGLSLSAFSSSASLLLVTPPCVPTPHLSVSQELRSPAALQRSGDEAAGDPTPAAGRRADEGTSSRCGTAQIMHRELVSRALCEDGPLLEEQETEGQRQLHSLLLQQLHTDVDIDRCVAKRKCFAPASLYRPFGQQAAGVRSLSQFQALQDRGEGAGRPAGARPH
ncbi:hypothetical protein KUCAC02_003129, partial [Chaenocephalus aceratus]